MAGIDERKLERMIAQTMLMERPLINALGEDWRHILTPEKIADLYRECEMVAEEQLIDPNASLFMALKKTERNTKVVLCLMRTMYV